MLNLVKEKIGILIYHKDIFKIYKERWVQKCLDSIRAQTFQDFTVYELCYSDTRSQLWENSNYSHIPMPNHIFSMNHILDKAFEDGCDVVFNVNLDDYFSPNRFQLQLDAIHAGYELVSSNFQHIEEVDGVDVPVRDMIFHLLDIKTELDVNHNILCHSVIAYTKKFWETTRYYDVNQLGYEDMELWRLGLINNFKMYIVPEILCFYRLSALQTGRIHAINPTNTDKIINQQ